MREGTSLNILLKINLTKGKDKVNNMVKVNSTKVMFLKMIALMGYVT
jgi:hypothetical protein